MPSSQPTLARYNLFCLDAVQPFFPSNLSLFLTEQVADENLSKPKKKTKKKVEQPIDFPCLLFSWLDICAPIFKVSARVAFCILSLIHNWDCQGSARGGVCLREMVYVRVTVHYRRLVSELTDYRN